VLQSLMEKAGSGDEKVDLDQLNSKTAI
jgi:hypothetical protein